MKITFGVVQCSTRQRVVEILRWSGNRKQYLIKFENGIEQWLAEILIQQIKVLGTDE